MDMMALTDVVLLERFTHRVVRVIINVKGLAQVILVND